MPSAPSSNRQEAARGQVNSSRTSATSSPVDRPDCTPEAITVPQSAATEHPLDRLQLGADDGQVLHLELLVGQVVDGPLGLGVAVVDPHRLGEAELEQRTWAAGD